MNEIKIKIMTQKLFKRLDFGFGWLVFVIAAVVYMLTLEPTVSFWDCGEFISSSYKLQVGHPPGAPFFMLIARFFAMFASGPEQVALMVNAFSGIVSAFTIMFLYWTIAYFAKRMIAPDKQYTTGKVIAIIGASLVGALVYTFSDTFWFSAVEGEVYAFSSFFTAIVFWAMLKWSDSDNDVQASRWILLIALLVGMSIGVHLLNLLTIPAIAFIFYFKKFKPNVKGFFITIGISLFIVAMIMWGIIPGVAIVASKLELFFVNGLGMPYNTGLFVWSLLTFGFLGASIYFTQYTENKILHYIFPSGSLLLIGAPFMADNIFINLLILAAMITGVVLTARKMRPVLNLIMLAFTMVMLGYSSYALIVIRSNANPPMDQNNPDDVFALLYYLNREQYGDRPLMYGEYFNAKPEKSIDTSPVYVKRDGGYTIVSYKPEAIYNSKDCTIFPRMYSADPTHVEVYKDYGGFKKTQTKPKFSNNIKFFVNYQLNWMYWRYFLWNYSGRQNDIQGTGSVINGNWISGISAIDNPRLGDQSKLPEYLKNNKANNKYYMLPLLLGLIGLGFQLFKHQKDWWIVTLLFLLTGIAIVVYLNQTPNQPRERDYAYAGSFYAFAIWIGLSVVGIYHLLKKISPAVVAGSIATLICIPVLLGLIGLGFQLFEHQKDWWVVTLLFILTGWAIVVCFGLSVVGIYYLLKKVSPSIVAGSIATLICLPVPYIMAKENWNDHDRSNRFIARDFAHNYLNTCAPNAILFTYGDNDTFPIWYAQEVEGIRPDVKVCCLPYFASDWYVDQMKMKTYDAEPLPLTFERSKYEPSVRDILYYVPMQKGEENGYISIDSLMNYVANDAISSFDYDGEKTYSYHRNKLYMRADSATVVNNGTVKAKDADKIESVIKFDLNRSYLVKNEMMTIDMLRTNNWNRPIYFTSIGSPNTLGLNEYFQNEGFAYRLVPIKSNSRGRIDSDILYDNLMNKYNWGNMNDPKVVIDNTINRTTRIVKIRDNFRDLALQLAQEGDTVRAKEVMAKCDEIMPTSIFVPGVFDVDYANAYYTIGKNEKGDEYLKEIVKVSTEELDFFFSLDRELRLRCEMDIQFSMETYRRVLRSLMVNNREEIFNELEPKFNEYMLLYEGR